MPLIILSLIAAAATTLLQLYVPILAGKAIDHIIGPGMVDMDGIKETLVKMLVVILLAALFQWIMQGNMPFSLRASSSSLYPFAARPYFLAALRMFLALEPSLETPQSSLICSRATHLP